jgi:SAM-dependent methyltransferase
MAMIGGTIGYRILRIIAPAEPVGMDGRSYAGRSKVEVLLGERVWRDIKDKVVVDFGCGAGAEAIELARHGAAQVYGIDILERLLVVAREEAAKANCRNVQFGRTLPEAADVIVSIDAFEHFADPAAVLSVMAGMLKPTGCVLASFGPTWYHPLGGHLFSVFPWAHLIFGEKALCRWRSHIRHDGAQEFSEVEGGLNQMTIRRFAQIVESSPFQFDWFETVPIRVVRVLHNRFTREFLTAVVRCRLIPRAPAARSM